MVVVLTYQNVLCKIFYPKTISHEYNGILKFEIQDPLQKDQKIFYFLYFTLYSRLYGSLQLMVATT